MKKSATAWRMRTPGETALQQQRFESGSGSALWQGDRARARARSLQTPRLIAAPSAGHPVTSYATC